MARDLEQLIQKFVDASLPENTAEKEAIADLAAHRPSWHSLFLALKKHTHTYDTKLHHMEHTLSTKVKEAAGIRYQGPKGHRAISKYLKQSVALPIHALKDPEGCWTTDPAQVDRLVQQAWAPVYAGNTTNPHTLIQHFEATYHQHIYRAPPQHTNPITPSGSSNRQSGQS